jgi:predicted membrane protein
MRQQIYDVLIFLIKGLWIGVCVGLVIALVNHFLTKDREKQRVRDDREHAAEIAKEIRKRDFIGFLKSWRSEIASFQMGHGNIAIDVLRTTYTPKLPLFHAAVAKIEGDFVDVATFQVWVH